MPVEVRYHTDPACPWSWASEPKVRKLIVEFGDELRFRLVMAGLARSFDAEWTRARGLDPANPAAALALLWLEVAAETGMPCDPLLWRQAPLASSYPACMAVKAAAEQGEEAAHRYLRRLREGIFCERRKLDHADALRALAGPAGIDTARFAVDLESHAITEAFGADLEEARDGDGRSGQRKSLPAAIFIGADGARHEVCGWRPYEAYRKAAMAAGATPDPGPPPAPEAVVGRFERATSGEVEAICERPAPVVEAELWAAAREWRLQPLRVLTGTLWQRA